MADIIDLSKYNTVTSWPLVAKNVSGVIVRVGYRGYTSGVITEDVKARLHCSAAKNNGLPLGLYFMSQAITEKEAIEEADFAISFAKEYKITLPIFIDSEDGDGTDRVVRADGLTKDVRTKITVVFCERVKSFGYEPGVYASTSWFTSRLDVNKLLKYKTWVAQYNPTCTAKFRVDGWQYTNSGIVSGIAGKVDMTHPYSFTTKAPNPYTTPKRILRRTTPMMTGEDVKWLQYELGMPENEIDGKFGDDTNAVYKKYLGF